MARWRMSRFLDGKGTTEKSEVDGEDARKLRPGSAPHTVGDLDLGAHVSNRERSKGL